MTAVGPIFICGAGRSGTTLLSNLLDEAGSFFCSPSEFHILELFHSLNQNDLTTFFARDYLFHDDLKLFLDQEYAENFDRYLELKYGQPRNIKLISRVKFSEIYTDHLKNINEFTPRSVFDAVYTALSICYAEGEKSYTSFIDKRPQANEIFAGDLKSYYPRAKFIHVIRDPRTRYISSKMRFLDNRSRSVYSNEIYKRDFVSSHAVISATSFYLAFMNAASLGSDYLVVRYEDLVNDREKEMRKVASFIDVEFDEALISQTRMGKPAFPVSSFKEGVSSNPADERILRFKDNTSDTERLIVHRYCGELASRFGYDLDNEVAGNRRRFKYLRGIRNEPLASFVPNRLRYLRKFYLQKNFSVEDEIVAVIRGFHEGRFVVD